MPAKKQPVILGEEEQAALRKAARSNKRSLRECQRARILLASAEGQSDATVAQVVGVHPNTVSNVRKRFAVTGTKSVRRAEQKKRKERLLDGKAEAHLVALGCAGPPEGRKVWTMHLLAGRLMEARVVDSVTGETVRQTLKKMSLNPG